MSTYGNVGNQSPQKNAYNDQDLKSAMADIDLQMGLKPSLNIKALQNNTGFFESSNKNLK